MIKILKIYSRNHRITVLSKKGQGVTFNMHLPESEKDT